jgi:type II secretory pathway pseudopilin PulG
MAGRRADFIGRVCTARPAPCASRSSRGITLLELAIVLSIVGVIVFIALPTLKPSEEEANIEIAKEFLAYLHGQEQGYFGLHGKYAPLKTIAEDPTLGPNFDQRFAVEAPEVSGIKFAGPQAEGAFYEIIAMLPDGTRYSVTTTGEINAITIPIQ